MTEVFERANPEDFDEIVDLANYVFSHSGDRCDFPTLLPKLYKKEHGTAIHHYVARGDGRIVAVVGAFPMRMRVAGEVLLVYGIGSVCVHPYRRKLGYMNTLMRLAQEAITASGADFGCLGGQRQRYQHFGYDRCGQSVVFTLNKTNVRHRYGRDAFQELSFRSMSADDADLGICQEWFALRPAHVIREPERFHDIQKSWNAGMWCVLTNGTPCGYLTASKDGKEVQELVTGDGRDPAEVLSAWIERQNIDRLKISLPPYDQKGIASLSSLSENVCLEAADNISIYNFPRVMKAFLQLKSGYAELPDGSLVLSVGGRSPFKIEMRDGCAWTEETGEPANLLLSYMDALAFLFGPLGGVASTALEGRCAAGPAGWAGRERALAQAWFPLPLFFDSLDNV